MKSLNIASCFHEHLGGLIFTKIEFFREGTDWICNEALQGKIMISSLFQYSLHFLL